MNKIYQKPFFDEKNAGFTLIELLVVVLIIGILSAVALPQYQKSVIKARTAEMLVWVKRYWDAQQIYKMTNGSFADCLNLLDLDYAAAFPVIKEGTAECVKVASTGKTGWKDMNLIGGGVVSPRGIVWGESSPYARHGFGGFPGAAGEAQWGALVGLCTIGNTPETEASWRKIIKNMNYTKVIQGNQWCYAQINQE